MIEQGTDNPLRTMGKLVANHLEDVVHRGFTAIVHFVHAGPIGQQQLNQVCIDILTRHVQWRMVVLVCSVDVSPGLDQNLAQVEVPLEVLQLLRLRAGSVQGRESFVVLFVHGGSITQVELDVVPQTVPGCHVQRSVVFIHSAAVDGSAKLKEVLGTSADGGWEEQKSICDRHETHIISGFARHNTHSKDSGLEHKCKGIRPSSETALALAPWTSSSLVHSGSQWTQDSCKAVMPAGDRSTLAPRCSRCFRHSVKPRPAVM